MKKWIVFGLCLMAMLLCAVIFRDYIFSGRVLLTTDVVVAGSERTLFDALTSLVPRWMEEPLLGNAGGGDVSFAGFSKGFYSSGLVWNNWVYPVACLFASFAFISHHIRCGGGACASLLGVVLAFWLGSNFTLIYAGHPHKPYIVMLFVLSLFSVAGAVVGSLSAALIWGSCVGLMFMQQPDVAMFFALFAGAYLIFRLWQEQGCQPLKWLKVLIPAAVVAFLFAAGPLLSGYKHHVKDTAQIQTQSPQEKWDYMTQWSFPPEESIAFIAPGYTGWRSGEAAGPYWGRMGRSAGWEQTHQGFRNFKLENTYLGFIPIAFALFALFSCRHSKHRNEIIFWSCATLVALSLSFGKFFPLYALFYKLPVVNNIRNPNKFLQVFQVGLAILTAYGFDALFCRRVKVGDQKAEHSAIC